MDIRVFCCLIVVCTYICSAVYVELPTYCSVVSTLMLGVSHVEVLVPCLLVVV